jgi:hypothetical protein
VRPPDPVAGDVARRAAERELRRAEYHRDDPGLIDRALNWLGDRIAELFSGSVGGNVTLLFVILLGGVIIFLVVRAGRPDARGGRRRRDDADPLAPVAAQDHRRVAAEHEAAGRWAEALREWLRAAIRTIEERGVLDPRPGRTGAATAREAGPLLPTVADDLGAAMTAFDEVWFGARPATAADATLAHRVADAVERAPIERRAPAGLAPPW